MKKLTRNLNRIVMFVAVLLLMLGSFSFPVQARNLIDMSWQDKGQMTLQFKFDDKLLEGMEVDAYLVADISENGEFTLIDELKDQPVTNLNGITDQSQWDVIIDTIEPYVYSHMSVTAHAVSDINGEAFFDGLHLGLYMIRTEALYDPVEACTYAVDTFLISVPTTDANDTWVNPVYAPVLRAKCSQEYPKTYEIRKVWKDTDNEDKRPPYISVDLYRDGEKVQTVELSASNNWFYSWSDMDYRGESGEVAAHDWTIKENISSDSPYTVSTSESSYNGESSKVILFTLENTYNEPETPPETLPETPDTPDEDTPTEDTPETPGIPDLPEVLGAFRNLPAVLGARRLPQTGQLWWPLPILLIAGVLFIIKGIRANRKNAG